MFSKVKRMDCSFFTASEYPALNLLLSFDCESVLESLEHNKVMLWLLILLIHRCSACSEMPQVSSAEWLGQLYH